ncbi:MAG: nucleotidyltransferase family protein [Acutalibacteraceae bacterium]|nr:nucleotidyltransferase family protein [Acutalibacteraceae bacterium]
MKKEQAVLLKLIGFSSMTDTYKDVNWEEVYSEAVSQSVSLLAFDSAAAFKNEMGEAVYNLWFKTVLKKLEKNAVVSASQKELVRLLDTNGHRYAIIKGEASAYFYEKPEMRILGDVDFLVEEDSRQAIKDLLIENGYRAFLEDHICHTVFAKPDAHLEMHFEVAGIPKGNTGEKIRAFLKNAVANAELKTIDTNSFFAVDDMSHGLILLLHKQHHLLGEGIGLRHLYDWAAFVNKTHSLSFWADEFIPFLKSIGLYDFMNVMTGLCCEYLGVSVPFWLIENDKELLSLTMEDILSGGNFGRKDKERGRVGILVSDRGKSGTKRSKLYYICSAVSKAVKQKHPIVNKIKILFPVLFAYRSLRYILLSAFGIRDSYIKLIPQAEKRKALYSKFHIFEVTENE